jgi:hypothetical protein
MIGKRGRVPRNLLLDHSVPRGLRVFLTGFRVKHAFEMGWHALRNGDLLEAAEKAGFEVLITADKNLRHQNRLTGRRIAVLVLGTNHWPTLERYGGRMVAVLETVAAGTYAEVTFERPTLRRRPRPTPG